MHNTGAKTKTRQKSAKNSNSLLTSISNKSKTRKARLSSGVGADRTRRARLSRAPARTSPFRTCRRPSQTRSSTSTRPSSPISSNGWAYCSCRRRKSWSWTSKLSPATRNSAKKRCSISSAGSVSYMIIWKEACGGRLLRSRRTRRIWPMRSRRPIGTTSRCSTSTPNRENIGSSELRRTSRTRLEEWRRSERVW